MTASSRSSRAITSAESSPAMGEEEDEETGDKETRRQGDWETESQSQNRHLLVSLSPCLLVSLPSDSGRVAGISLLKPRQTQLAEVLLRGLAQRRSEHGEVAPAQLQLDVNAVGDFLGVAQGIVHAGKGRVHLIRAAEKELVGFHPHAVRVGTELARVDAQQDVLGLGVLAVDIVDVAGGHQGNTQPLGNLHRPGQHDPLRLKPVSALRCSNRRRTGPYTRRRFPGPFPCSPRRRPAACGSVRWRRSR